MNKETKTCIRIYTIADYDKEETWLREMAKQGWRLKKVVVCVYTFERFQPQDMVYKLEFRETPIAADQEYMNMLEDFGWKYVTSCNNFVISARMLKKMNGTMNYSQITNPS